MLSVEELLGLSLGVSSVPFDGPFSAMDTWPPNNNPFCMQGLGDGASAYSLSLPSYPEPAFSAPTADSVREHRAGLGVLVPSKIFGQIILKRSRPEDSGSGSGLVTIPPVPTPLTLLLDFSLESSLPYMLGALKEILMGALSQSSLDVEVVKKVVGGAGKPRHCSYTSAAQFHASCKAIREGPAPDAALGKERVCAFGFGRRGDHALSAPQILGGLQGISTCLTLKESIGTQSFGGVPQGKKAYDPPNKAISLFDLKKVAATAVSVGKLLDALDTPAFPSSSSSILCGNISQVAYPFEDSPPLKFSRGGGGAMSPSLSTAVSVSTLQLSTSASSIISCGAPSSEGQTVALDILCEVKVPVTLSVRLPVKGGGIIDTRVPFTLLIPKDGYGPVLHASMGHPNTWTGPMGTVTVPATVAVAELFAGKLVVGESLVAMGIKGALCGGCAHFNHTPKHQSEAGEYPFPTHPHPHHLSFI